MDPVYIIIEETDYLDHDQKTVYNEVTVLIKFFVFDNYRKLYKIEVQGSSFT